MVNKKKAFKENKNFKYLNEGQIQIYSLWKKKLW